MPIATTIATRITSTFSRQTAFLCGGVWAVKRASSRLRFFVGGALVARLHGRVHFVDLPAQLRDGRVGSGDRAGNESTSRHDE